MDNAKYLLYRIKLENYRIQVVCDYCYKNGQVNKRCNKCGGKSVHNKTRQRWVVCKHLQLIDKIDRDSEGNIRYWEDMSCFYQETDKLIHFTYRDAEKECNKRNKDIIETEKMLHSLEISIQ